MVTFMITVSVTISDSDPYSDRESLLTKKVRTKEEAHQVLEQALTAYGRVEEGTAPTDETGMKL